MAGSVTKVPESRRRVRDHAAGDALVVDRDRSIDVHLPPETTTIRTVSPVFVAVNRKPAVSSPCGRHRLPIARMSFASAFPVTSSRSDGPAITTRVTPFAEIDASSYPELGQSSAKAAVALPSAKARMMERKGSNVGRGNSLRCAGSHTSRARLISQSWRGTRSRPARLEGQ